MTMTHGLKTLAQTLLAVLLVACSGRSPAPAEPGRSVQILSAYYGLSALPAMASIPCGGHVAGQDGMPLVFSEQLESKTVTPDAFVVEVAGGLRVVPSCATLAPARESLEQRTVLLAGEFGTPEVPPHAVEVVGALQDASGSSLTGLRIEAIVALGEGPRLALAERFAPDTPGLAGECPDGTEQVVQLTWQGGVSGPQGAALAEPQRAGVSITLEDGTQATPLALADDDPDNHVLACLASEIPAQSVAVAAGLFHDPGDDANPETSVPVLPTRD